MATIKVKTSSYPVSSWTARSGFTETEKHFVEVWIAGVCYRTDATSKKHAMQLAFNTAHDLGIAVGDVDS